MTEEVKQELSDNTNTNSTIETIVSGSVGDIIADTNSGINDIVRIKKQEQFETGLFSGVYNSVRDRFYQALGVTLDPSIFAEMTDTLNKHREILEMGIPDNHEINQKISI